MTHLLQETSRIICSVASIRLQACPKNNLTVSYIRVYLFLLTDGRTVFSVLSHFDSCHSSPVRRLGGDECAQRCECCVDRVGAIPLPCIGCVPLAALRLGRRHRGAKPPCHGPYFYPTYSRAQLPLPVHLDVKGRW